MRIIKYRELRRLSYSNMYSLEQEIEWMLDYLHAKNFDIRITPSFDIYIDKRPMHNGSWRVLELNNLGIERFIGAREIPVLYNNGEHTFKFDIKDFAWFVNVTLPSLNDGTFHNFHAHDGKWWFNSSPFSIIETPFRDFKIKEKKQEEWGEREGCDCCFKCMTSSLSYKECDCWFCEKEKEEKQEKEQEEKIEDCICCTECSFSASSYKICHCCSNCEFNPSPYQECDCWDCEKPLEDPCKHDHYAEVNENVIGRTIRFDGSDCTPHQEWLKEKEYSKEQKDAMCIQYFNIMHELTSGENYCINFGIPCCDLDKTLSDYWNNELDNLLERGFNIKWVEEFERERKNNAR